MKALATLLMAFALYGCHYQEPKIEDGMSFADAEFAAEIQTSKPVILNEENEIVIPDIQPDLQKLTEDGPMEIKHPIDPKDHSQIVCLAKNIYFESRGEPLDGQYAVANVTMNRLRSGVFADTVCGVVYQSRQFSWTSRSHSIRNQDAYEKAFDIAVEVYYNNINDITRGAQYFHATYVRPKWASSFTRTIKIGSHLFYRN